MILDTDYITKDGKPIIRIFKKENGEFKIELDRNFQPYIYALLESDDAIEEVKKITAKRGNKTVRVLKAEKVQKKFLGRPIEVWKLIFEHPQDVPAIREKIREHPKVIDIFEYDIPFAKRYLIDKGLIPMEGDEELKLLAFDIETFYHEGEQFGEGEIIMISYADENEAKVITWKKIDLPYVEVVSSEREMIKRFVQIVREKDPDVLITYNGDNFDLPYLIKRAQKLGLRLFISRDKEHPEPKIQRMGDRFAVEIKGRIHFDLFPVVKRTINLPTYTLEAVYEAVLGKKKTKLEAAEITAIWESEEGMKELAKYSMEDAKATYELGKEFFPMEAELARLIGQSVWDVSRSSTGNLVEWFLLRVAYQRNELAPNKPSDEEYQRRLRTTYLGGYVKEPERGLWENIVYLDFRCHPADTKVVVKGRGIVNISEVKEGDYVLGINGWHKVLKVWEYDYDGELINVNGLKCTPNHKLPVVTQKKRQTVIRDSYAKSMLTNKVRGRIITTDLFESIGGIEKQRANLSEEFILKSELAGIILAEGHLLRKDIRYFDSSRRRYRVSHQYRVEITVNEDEKELIDRINYIFEKLFGCRPSIRRKKNSKALTLQCAKKSVYLEIENIMREIENLDASSVLRGFFEGDGTINTVGRTVVANQGTRNKKKIELISKLLNKLGIRHSIYTHTDEKNGKRYTRYIIEIPWRGELVKFATLVGFISTRKKELLKRIIEQREMYQLENSGFYRLKEIHATKEYYKGKVYDLTLEGAPYYFANGILTHNSLYPSIIITHNVSPDTLEREGCKNYDVAPIVGYRFCKDFKGFISSILEELIETRTKIKKEMKATIDPVKRKMLDYRQKAVKLLANSHYGYMGYPKARWYSKECAESVTAWGRTYIETTIKEIEEKFGFKVLYADSVTGDTEIIIKENERIKFVKIKDLFKRTDYSVGEKEYCMLENIEALTLDNYGRLVWRKVPYVMRHKAKKRVYRIWFTNSWYLDVTEDHSLIGYLTTRELGGKKPLRERLIEVKPEELGRRIKSLITLNGAFARSASTTEVGTKLWELIGLLVGDGNWGGNSHWANYYVGLSTGEDLAEIERKILIPLKEAGIISNYYPKGKPGDISILSKWLAKFMNKYFKENGRKRIPEFMFRLPREYIAAFLRGLFTTDGTVSVRKSRGTLEVRLTNVNEDLINDVRRLLWLVGVSNSLFRESNPNRYKGKSSGTHSFHLRIKDKHAFIKKIGFITDRKNKRLENLKEAVPKSGIRRYQFDLVQPKKIEEIKYDDYVYDIEVEETHRFFANGILVHNTDGLYATIPGADAETIKKKAKEFLKYINSKLPGLLELEYEGFYLRGFFVTKKRYAVIDEEGKITTRGLEVVRRDWSEIAKETQAKVLEAILKDGSVEKAVEVVKKVVEDLAKYKVPLEKLVIHEQITKSLDEYKATGPHVAVAKRLKAKGIKVRPGMIISYIILKGDKKISDRAILLSEYDPKKHKYDPDYYIEHQVLPAVLRILEAFGYRKEDLRYQKTKQLGLGAWLNVRK
ncbi:DNA polymerase domain-containing protein [Thermococcus sp. SY098]|uniref:DNA polymerase domain-containing protein n=1 Tax=Thermococcus sp. SY098 TaxID=3111325 RepID=UPI002D78B8E9|nr:DNA polymerase domain-containing protein [Thermococcus sp. SY098]WRS51706.1 DNA polymerase domain-containing protein [Thermococcus sp. SY098]